MGKFKVKDFVGVSRKTFSDTYRDAIRQAKTVLPGDIGGVEVSPPFYVVITENREIEFRSTVRIVYETDD